MSSAVREPRVAFRGATNVSLDASMIDEAKALGINVSRSCEDGLARQVASERRTRWMENNAEAIAASNAYVAEHGLPWKNAGFFDGSDVYRRDGIRGYLLDCESDMLVNFETRLAGRCSFTKMRPCRWDVSIQCRAEWRQGRHDDAIRFHD